MGFHANLTGLPVNQFITPQEAFTVLKPVALFVAGMMIYAIFIFRFYRFLARKDIIELDLTKYNTSSHPVMKKVFAVIYYIIQYIVLIPLFVFFWFIVLTILLAFLAKNPVPEEILLVSIAVVAAVRISAYYNEQLSVDLAKMLPFALLGIFLIDISYFNFWSSIDVLGEIPQLWNILLYYLLFVVSLEFVLRLVSVFVVSETDKETAQPPQG